MYYLSLIVLAAVAAFGQQPDYFPLQVGNQWVYRSGPRFTGATVVDVSAIRKIDDREYFVVNGFPGGTLLLRKDDEGTLLFYDFNEGKESTWVAFGAATGTGFPTSIDNCNNAGTIATTEGELRSPLGSFNNALRVNYSLTCADAGLTSESYLPSIGLAQRRMSNIAGEVVWDLIYAHVGFTVVGGSEFSFGVTLDGSVYKEGGPVIARMTLRSTLDQPSRVTFQSGQEYDVLIRNQADEVVYQSSRGILFTQFVHSIEVLGEKNWVVTIPLNTRTPLPAGKYFVTARLTPADGRFEASVPLTIVGN